MESKEIYSSFDQDPKEDIQLNHWIFEMIAPYIKGRTLEMGSGCGAISSLFIDRGLPIHLSESIKLNREKIREQFDGNPLTKSLKNIDYMSTHFEVVYKSLFGAFDTVVALNITEHGPYEKEALQNATYLLRVRGHLIAVTRTSTALFSDLEEDLEDWRRFSINDSKKMMGANFTLLKVRFFMRLNNQPNPFAPRFNMFALAAYRKTV